MSETKENTITLTGEQRRAVDAAVAFLDEADQGARVLRIGGYAGTGKTTLAKTIIVEAQDECDMTPEVCAFTGKACAVLRRKGLTGAQTIHSTIYEWDEHLEEFRLTPIVPGDYFLVDEGSMISTAIWQDMLKFRKPIIVIGDPGQLEPVGDDPKLMHNPDIVLQQIHRQDADNPIVQFATDVRLQRHKVAGINDYPPDHKQCRILPRSDFWDAIREADQALCGFNRTRVKANKLIRRAHGAESKRIVEGERLICLQNNRNLGVWNGQFLTVDRIRHVGREYAKVDLRDEQDEKRPNMKLWLGHLHREKKIGFYEAKEIGDAVIADYGYCTTVHKFQGSEDRHVAVIDEQCDVWNPVRWRYTAITRAAQELTYCI